MVKVHGAGIPIAEIGGPVYHVNHVGSMRISKALHRDNRSDSPWGDLDWHSDHVTYNNPEDWGLGDGTCARHARTAWCSWISTGGPCRRLWNCGASPCPHASPTARACSADLIRPFPRPRCLPACFCAFRCFFLLFFRELTLQLSLGRLGLDPDGRVALGPGGPARQHRP